MHRKSVEINKLNNSFLLHVFHVSRYFLEKSLTQKLEKNIIIS